MVRDADPRKRIRVALYRRDAPQPPRLGLQSIAEKVRMSPATRILLAAAAALGVSVSVAAAQDADERTAAAFAAADVNRDGVIDVDEYVAYFVGVHRALDADGDGRVVPGDLGNVDAGTFDEADRDEDGGASLGEAVADRMIVFFAADADGNGVLTLLEIQSYDPS